jgi:hypothetical protein
MWNAILAYFPYFEEKKRGLWHHLAVCVCLWIPPLIFKAYDAYSFLLFILTANGFLPDGSGTTIRHNTNF